eukprot:553129-Amphidinium_carterae.1
MVGTPAATVQVCVCVCVSGAELWSCENTLDRSRFCTGLQTDRTPKHGAESTCACLACASRCASW